MDARNRTFYIMIVDRIVNFFFFHARVRVRVRVCSLRNRTLPTNKQIFTKTKIQIIIIINFAHFLFNHSHRTRARARITNLIFRLLSSFTTGWYLHKKKNNGKPGGGRRRDIKLRQNFQTAIFIFPPLIFYHPYEYIPLLTILLRKKK